MNKMRFTLSVILAINELDRLRCGFIEGASRPCWSNFRFFSDIEPLPVKRVRRVERTEELLGHWVLNRTVNFYRYHRPVAVVQLTGKKIDTIAKSCGEVDSCEANTVFWAVYSIEYAPNDDTPREEWIKLDLPVTGLTSGRI